MLTHCYCLALALALAAVWPGHATAQDASGFDRFRLFNECRPMRLVVEEYDNDAPAAIGLTEARIRTLAESRLRAARGPAYGGGLYRRTPKGGSWGRSAPRAGSFHKTLCFRRVLNA